MWSLRPFGFALGWLVLFEVLLRLACAPAPQAARDPEHPYGCFADDELERLLQARAADPPQGAPADIVLVGDSVLASVENTPGDRLADALSIALQRVEPAGRPFRVWTLAAGGARASDVYAVLRRVARELRAGRRGTQDVVLVVSSNVIFFSQRHRVPEMAYPCLADELPEREAGADEAELRARRALAGPGDSPLRRWEHGLLRSATAHIYLLQQRRRLAQWLFGGPPRLALREGLQNLRRHRAAGPAADELAARDRPWTERGLSAAQFAGSYDFVPLDSADAHNLLWTRALAHWLGAQPDLRALAVLVPQNHALLGPLAEGAAYDALSRQLAATFGRAGVPFVSYDHDPAILSAHFLDLDHLTAAGNRALANRLAAELAVRLGAERGRVR